MCGVNALPLARNEYHFMTRGTANHLASQLSRFAPRARVEFAMRGEPLLNPEWPELVGIFRAALPQTQLMMTTNGTAFLRGWRALEPELRRLNVLIVDLYEPYGPELREMLVAWARGQTFWRVVDFYAETFSPWTNHGGRGHVIVLMEDLMKMHDVKSTRKLENHAGSSPLVGPVAAPLAKTCTLPFRELVVHYDGAVPLCCMDFRREYICGNVLAADLARVWGGERLMAARRMLGAKDRGFAPCRWCNVGSGMRSGLLPKLPPPTVADRALVGGL